MFEYNQIGAENSTQIIIVIWRLPCLNSECSSL